MNLPIDMSDDLQQGAVARDCDWPFLLCRNSIL